MKRTAIFLACVLLCGMTTACGALTGGHASSLSVSSSESVSSADTQPNRGNKSEKPEGRTPRQAYAEALTRLMDRCILPNGEDTGPVIGGPEMASTFAIADVDGDGREELVLQYTDTFVAGNVGMVSEYDPKQDDLKTELTESPSLTFYDNGLVRADWSHNQGKAGDFWPYTLYRYQKANDSYSFAGGVDAWQQQAFPEGYPAEIDQSGSGFVYYICEEPPFSWEHPVDASVYQAWYDGEMGEAHELKLNYLALNEQNIRQITEEAEQVG